jgi:AbrB family looped-hinge helix DNA binding protein
MYFMEMAKVTSKGQITIPVSIRRRLNINEGDKLLFIDSQDGVMMVNPDMLSAGSVTEILESETRIPEFSSTEAPKTYVSNNKAAKLKSPEDMAVAKTAPKEEITVEIVASVPDEAVLPDEAESFLEMPETDAAILFNEEQPTKAPDTDSAVPDEIGSPAEASKIDADVLDETETVASVPKPDTDTSDKVDQIVETVETFKPNAVAEDKEGPAVEAAIPLDEVKKPVSQAHGVDLNKLLDEIRSIGSKI